jgi:HD-like signal output (HDOD) protein
MNAIEYAEQVSEVFVLSDSFLRIKELIDNEISTIDDIAEVILLDPALSGTLLKLANSSFFSYPGKIDTISKAVLVLGITEVYNLVIAYFTTDAFKRIEANADYLELFWERSIDCALLIKFLGGAIKTPNPERLFILGLLHNLGELVVHQVSPDMVLACEIDDISVLPWQKQLAVLGFTYAQCTAALLKQWQLPVSLIKPISCQDSDDYSNANDRSQLLCIAKRVMCRNTFYPENIYSDVISDEQLTMAGIEGDLLPAAASYCDLERLNILCLLKPASAMIY